MYVSSSPIGANLTKIQALIRATDGTDDRKELASCIRRIAFLGTPHGVDAASWGETARKFLMLSRSPDVPITEDWIRRLAKFDALGERFPAVVEARSRNAETRLEVACFYEGQRTACGNGSMTLADELSVSIPRCPPPERLEANHQNLGVFPNKEDPNFRRVCRQLVRWARDLSKPSGNDQQARFVSNATFSGPNNSGFQLGMNTGTLNEYSIDSIFPLINAAFLCESLINIPVVVSLSSCLIDPFPPSSIVVFRAIEDALPPLP
ncbi:hypothetical protein AUP68_08814 [Ilyonectria robusta]